MGDLSVRILHGDCREVLRKLPDASAQCCVTSPPYYGLRDYGVAGQIGLEQSPDEYVAQLVEVFRSVRRVLRGDGTAWLNLGDSYAMSTKGAGGRGKQHTNVGSVQIDRRWQIPNGAKPKDLIGIPWRVAFALQADGWWLRSAIVWHKPNPMPESVRDRPTSAHEMVFLLAKAGRYFFDADAVAEASAYVVSPDRKTSGLYSEGSGRNDHGGHRSGGFVTGATHNIRNVWTIATQPFPGSHFATMPPDLAERCIKAGTSERGACPTCGSPWVRIVTKGEPDTAHKAACGADASGGYNGKSTKDHASAGVQDASAVKARILAGMRERISDWQQSCMCPAAAPAPCAVLDPFFGAGTTGLVADRLGRDCIGIELNPAYTAMASARVERDAGLFAEVAAE